MTYRDSIRPEPWSPASEIFVSASIDVPCAEVARLCCDFRTLDVWHPAFRRCEVEGEGVGAVRRLDMGGAEVRERLENAADDGTGYAYKVLAHPFPIRSSRGFVSVREGPREGTSVLEWAVTFVPSLELFPAAVLAKAVEAMCKAGVMAAKTQLECNARQARV